MTNNIHCTVCQAKGLEEKPHTGVAQLTFKLLTDKRQGKKMIKKGF